MNSEIVCQTEGAFCGGKEVFHRCENQRLKCQLNDNYPEAGGKCVKSCSRAGEMCEGLKVCIYFENFLWIQI